MLAGKAIMMKWVGDDSPSVQLRKSLISDAATSEKLRHFIGGGTHLFFWKKMRETIESSRTEVKSSLP